jgi:hypothetical protein
MRGSWLLREKPPFSKVAYEIRPGPSDKIWSVASNTTTAFSDGTSRVRCGRRGL